jgi:hypothetical protein
MAAPIFDGSTDGAFATAANWSTGSAPIDADIVTFNGIATRGIDGSDQSAIEPARTDVYKSFLYTIGSSTTALTLGSLIVNIGLPSDDGTSPAGPSQVFLNNGTDPVVCTIHDARPTGVSGFPCIVMEAVNASNTMLVKGGSVGTGLFTPGLAATWATITVNGPTANMTIGTNVTLTTLLIQDGTCLMQSSVTTIDHQGGDLETRGTGTATTIYAGGRSAKLGSTGTITTLRVSGVCNCVLSGSGLAARTISNAFLSGTQCKLDLRGTGTAITFTNGIDLKDGASAAQILTDDEITVTLAAA